MPLDAPTFYDNICVFAGKHSNEYLQLSFSPAEEDKPYKISISRYYVPGRGDTYCFSWFTLKYRPAALSYYSEANQSVAKTMKMVEKDFDKPQVVEMALRAFQAERIVLHYRYDFLLLLKAIAPKSKTYRAVNKLCEKTIKERTIRIENEKLAKQKNPV